MLTKTQTASLKEAQATVAMTVIHEPDGHRGLRLRLLRCDGPADEGPVHTIQRPKLGSWFSATDDISAAIGQLLQECSSAGAYQPVYGSSPFICHRIEHLMEHEGLCLEFATEGENLRVRLHDESGKSPDTADCLIEPSGTDGTLSQDQITQCVDGLIQSWPRRC